MHYAKQMQSQQPMPPGMQQIMASQPNQMPSNRLHQSVSAHNNLNSLPTETLLYGNHRPSTSERTTAMFALPS